MSTSFPLPPQTPQPQHEDAISTPQLKVILTYNVATIAVKDVFAIALDVMVLGAEKGPSECVSRITTATFDMLLIYSAHGQTELRYKALVKMIRVLIRQILAIKRLAEVDVEMRRDGVVVALGRLKNRVGVGSLYGGGLGDVKNYKS